MKTLFFLALFLSVPFLKANEPIPYFVPPKDWTLADPQFLSGAVRVNFLSKEKKGFCPSLNLAVEKGVTSKKEYLETIKKIHEGNPLHRYRDIGKMITVAGEAHLSEIDLENSLGKVRLMQMIFIKDETAYILTASALKEEFGHYYKEFKKAFTSFTICNDLLEAVNDTTKQEQIKTRLTEIKSVLTSPISRKEKETQYLFPLQAHLAQNHSDLGLYWQLLVLQQANNK